MVQLPFVNPSIRQPSILMFRIARICVGAAVLLIVPALTRAQAPVEYRLSFPAPEHRWMQVDVTFSEVPPVPLELRMSRSSPGRYALHEFSKNVYDVRITDAAGRPLAVTRPDLHRWTVPGHSGAVRASYKVFGDRVDGTYLAIDHTHAHINMPAALMWARDFEQRPAIVRFEPPAGASWQIATQLLPGPDGRTFTAPNLQYLMDSPSEFSAFSLRTFTVPDGDRRPLFRVALHHQGTDDQLQAFARDAEVLVRETREVFGAFPAFEGNTYTFIADYLPWANGDGMEHRNSTILTSSQSLRDAHGALLGAVAHEFVHAWNVERIRPRSLEPFQFDDANVSGELWLAEGFTNYYGPLMMRRAGLVDLPEYTRDIATAINAVTLSPGRRIRSAEEMSRLAPFVDAAAAIDRTSFENTFLSYYTWGEAIGLGLDLALRARSDGKITLDHYMRTLWEQFGTSGQRVPGYVERPYTIDDLKGTLAMVSGDPAFAADFFARYIQGHEVIDYAPLLARAGLVLRPSRPGQGYAGAMRLEVIDGKAQIAGSVPFGSPAYEAGLERDDVVLSAGGESITKPGQFDALVRRQKPGTMLAITFSRRGGPPVKGILRLIQDPQQEIEAIETHGRLTGAQRQFRDAWLSSRQRRVF